MVDFLETGGETVCEDANIDAYSVNEKRSGTAYIDASVVRIEVNKNKRSEY